MAISGVLKEVSEQDNKRRQHASEDKLGKWDKTKVDLFNKMPFAGGCSDQTGPAYNCDGSEMSIEQQLTNALEREDYAKAIELRDKMKER